MENSSDIRKKVKRRLCHAVLLYAVIIYAACIGWNDLYRCLASDYISLKQFIIFMLIGAVILESLIGLLQAMKKGARHYFFPFHACTAIALLWCLYVIICIFKGIRPQKNTDIILGIFLSMLLSGVTLLLAFIVYCRVDVMGDLYRCSKKLDEHLKIYGEGVSQYNQSASLYNGMNQKINHIASVIGKRQGKQKYIEGFNENIDVPLLEISAVRIFGSRDQIQEYMHDVNELCIYIERKMTELQQQMFYMDAQVAKKEDLVIQAGRTADMTQNRVVFSEKNRKNMLSDVKSSYKGLAKRSRLEKKIKNIKKG